MNPQGEEKLIEFLDQYKAQKRKYDCMVGLSGGRDSTYLML
jgi:tRNA(Ile)-lysidine synthase TilS/MesJ